MTVEKFVPSTALITLTPSARAHFEKQLADKAGSLVRLSTKVSGCTGFAYVIEIVDSAEENDEVLKFSDALSVAVAEQAHDLVRNTEIDYVMEGVNGVIKYNNPNVVNECGCGESFSVG